MKRKRKRARSHQKTAKHLQFEQVTPGQIDEMALAMTQNINARIWVIMKTKYPDMLPLREEDFDFFVTAQRFPMDDMVEIMKQALKQCDEEREAFGAVALLSWANRQAPLGTV